MKKPFSVYLLLVFVFLQAVSGIGGGLAILIDPSGKTIQFPEEVLDKIPFPNFLIPGLILFFLLGIIPMLVFYGLIKQPNWKLFEKINIYKDHHWSWIYSIYVSVMLTIWLNVEAMFIGYDPLQTVMGLISVAIIICALMPQVNQYYKRII